MAVKKGNKVVQVNLTDFHIRKLALLESRTGLSKSGIVQRLIEDHKLGDADLFQKEEKNAK